MKKPALATLSGLPLWATLSALLLVGLATTVMDHLHAPADELARANSSKQHAIIDAATGAVSLGSAASATDTSFDVAEKPPEPETVAPPEAPTAAKAPSAEVHAEATPATNTAPLKTPEAAEVTAAPAVTPESAAPAVENLPAGLTPLRTTPTPAPKVEVARTQASLVPAPAPEITETVDHMTLPKKAEGGASASALYAQRFQRTEEQHLITILVTDVGLNAQSIPLLLTLPKQVTIAMSPYGRKASQAVETMRNAGFETWAMLPTMGERYPQDDPGPLGLIASMPKEEMLRRLHSVISDLIGSVGVVLPPDENLSSKKEAFATILNEVTARGLFVASTHPTHSLEQLTGDKALKAAIRRSDVILDNEPDTAQIESKLAGVAAAAMQKDTYIIVTSARPQTLRILANWLSQTKFEAPLVLAPLSAHYQPKAPPPPPAPVEEKSGGHH